MWMLHDDFSFSFYNLFDNVFDFHEMTRINSNVSPNLLIDNHLLAEYHEITRLTSINFNKTHQIPKTFRLGTGHVKFFYDKQLFLHKRYESLREELICRGFVLKTDLSYKWEQIKKEFPTFYNDYEFTKDETELSLIRLTRSLLKIHKKSKLRYIKKELNIRIALFFLMTDDDSELNTLIRLLRKKVNSQNSFLFEQQLLELELLKQRQLVSSIFTKQSV